jgi:hypothetical protein
LEQSNGWIVLRNTDFPCYCEWGYIFRRSYVAYSNTVHQQAMRTENTTGLSLWLMLL